MLVLAVSGARGSSKKIQRKKKGDGFATAKGIAKKQESWIWHFQSHPDVFPLLWEEEGGFFEWARLLETNSALLLLDADARVRERI